ncbi:PRC-barrel domain-containing protein [Clostridium sp. D2Q-11]|uniref:PRC-barrel domain-containing protein n=1 Tax=Anaeromonas frigoriresistens TaxID=2683708 RepID=A0A942V548_9FIRM|nr:PRC-barrel domain-containing protein [Anaeromonas frigoriresistens]MBS4540047.1 PRC-barrel domain-containing protein [Anaeromonas frigoriresistens]
MKRTKKIMRFDIIDNQTGDKLGTVKDFIFSRQKLRIVAILVSEGGLFKEEKIIRYKNISSIGKDFITVEKKNIVEKLKDFPEIEKESESDNDIIGLPVLIEDGENIGYIDDIVFEEKNGTVMGFLLTDGIIQDILDGRNMLPFLEVMSITKKALIIDKQFKDDYEKNKEKFKKLLVLD